MGALVRPRAARQPTDPRARSEVHSVRSGLLLLFREGLLTDAEFERAKEKILREEPDHEYACMSPGVPPRSLATEDMTREGGGERARVFGISLIWEPSLVIIFCSSVHTVLRKVLKRGCQKMPKVAPKVRPGAPGAHLWGHI